MTKLSPAGAGLGRIIRRLVLAGAVAAAVSSSAPAGRAAERDMHISAKPVRDEVRAVVEAQLAALRSGDFATAYDFAAREIRRQFDERVFALMIRRGYAPLLRPGRSELGVVRDDGDGLAQVNVTVIDPQNRSTVYRYWLVKEGDTWRINGVVLEQRPPRGDT